MKPRRWPYITTAIIAVSLLFFLLTHRRLQQEANQYLEIESQTVSLAAVHPDLPVTPAQRSLIDVFRQNHARDWDQMASVQGGSANSDEIKNEMTRLGWRLDDFHRDSLTSRFTITLPSHRSLISTLTANFLHRDWINLIFNMCFLWLVGGTLEDLWGRGIYAGIIFLSGILGISAYLTAYPNSPIPPVGASGSLAVLMGFYLIRFPKTTIERGTTIWVVRPRLLRFSSPVYIVFPMWLLGLMFWGRSTGETTYAAYLALTLAFIAGLLLALLLWVTGVEQYMSEKIEAEVAWSVDEHLANASEHLQTGDLDSAIGEVTAQIAEKPASVEAHEMLVSLYSRKGNALIKYLQSLESLCEVQLKAAYPEAAWEVYETYIKAGGRKMPAATWFQLARFAENRGDWQRALTEYEEFAQAWPEERNTVLALISAGRIQLQQFGKREEAVRLYTAARNSKVPHSDWDEMIRKGLEKSGGLEAPKTKKSPVAAGKSKQAK